MGFCTLFQSRLFSLFRANCEIIDTFYALALPFYAQATNIERNKRIGVFL